MEQGAAWLCDRVLPPVPLRQWVLSLPGVLRYLLAYDGKLLRAVSSAAMGEVFRFLRLRARRFIVPGAPEDDDRGCGHSVAYEETRIGKTIRRRWIPRAELLLKVFAVDVFDCPECHARIQRIVFITETKAIKAILECVERKERPP